MHFESTGHEIIMFFRDSLNLPDFQLYHDEGGTDPLDLSLTLF
jgi:hypothetical protein